MTSKFLPDSNRPEGFMPPYRQNETAPVPIPWKKSPASL